MEVTQSQRLKAKIIKKTAYLELLKEEIEEEVRVYQEMFHKELIKKYKKIGMKNGSIKQGRVRSD